MPRKAKGLTAAKVRAAAPGRYGDGGGLYLLVRPDGGRFWLYRYVIGGRMREMGLGGAGGRDAVTLSNARVKARKLWEVVRAGRDPLEDRQADAEAKRAAALAAQARAKSFRDVADAYIAGHEAGWRNAKHRTQWSATLEAYAHPIMGSLPVADVDTGHVMAVLEPIWRTKAETASRLRGRIEAILDYAKARGWRSGENPARWRGHVANMLPNRAKVQPVEHHAALPWREIGGFIAALRPMDGLAAQALLLTILTAARSGEILGSRWSEIDLSEAVWTIPGSRMKAGREHRVPLSEPAMAVLHGLLPLRDAEAGDWMFPGRRRGCPLSGTAMEKLLRRMGRGDLTVHGFRSTFRDWAAETTGYAREVAEAALAHTLGDKVEAAYRRGDLFEKRRRLTDDWAEFCARPSDGMPHCADLARRAASGRVGRMRLTGPAGALTPKPDLTPTWSDPMGKADDDATTPRANGASEPTVYSIPPFPVEALDLPDKDLVLTFWACWLAHQAASKGISPECLTPEIAENIRIATLGVDADDVAHAALEKILRRIAACAPGHETKTAEMIRVHIKDGALHVVALDEAATGRRRQRAISRKPRTDGLQSIILEVMRNKPSVTVSELIAQLRLYPTGEIIDGINDDDETIDWHDTRHLTTSTPFSALKHRMSRARRKLASR